MVIAVRLGFNLNSLLGLFGQQLHFLVQSLLE
jgi:hypothetical protein